MAPSRRWVSGQSGRSQSLVASEAFPAAELADNLAHIAMLAVNRIVHGADLRLRNLAREPLNGAPDHGMLRKGLLTNQRHRLVRRKVV